MCSYKIPTQFQVKNRLKEREREVTKVTKNEKNEEQRNGPF